MSQNLNSSIGTECFIANISALSVYGNNLSVVILNHVRNESLCKIHCLHDTAFKLVVELLYISFKAVFPEKSMESAI